MLPPDTALLEDLSLAELRDLGGMLVAEVRALRVEAEAEQAKITALRAENQLLRDEVARQGRQAFKTPARRQA